MSDENWPALSEVKEPAGPTQKKTSMKATPSQTSSSVQSNSDSGGDDSSKENKENGSASENGQRTPKKKGLASFVCFFCCNPLCAGIST